MAFVPRFTSIFRWINIYLSYPDSRVLSKWLSEKSKITIGALYPQSTFSSVRMRINPFEIGVPNLPKLFLFFVDLFWSHSGARKSSREVGPDPRLLSIWSQKRGENLGASHEKGDIRPESGKFLVHCKSVYMELTINLEDIQILLWSKLNIYFGYLFRNHPRST